MKYTVTIIAIILISVLCVTPAFAAIYSDDDNNLTIDINYGDGVYYYTPEKNNLFNDLTQKISQDGRDVRFYITRYNEDSEQPYSLTVTAQPLNITESAEVNLFDITTFEETVKSNILSGALEELTSDYNFTDPVNSVLGGVNALLIKGVGKEDPQDKLDLYVNANGSNYIITQAQYSLVPDTVEIDALIDSLKYSDEVVAAAQTNPVVQTDGSSPSPAPTVINEITSVSEEGEQNLNDSANNNKTGAFAQIEAFFTGAWNSIVSAYQNDPFFICYVIGAAIILAIVIILIVMTRRRRSKEKEYDSQFDVEEDLTVFEEISITPHDYNESDKNKPRLLMGDFNGQDSAPRKIVHMMDDNIVHAPRENTTDKGDENEADDKLKNARIDEQINLEEEEDDDMSNVADFEKDISKYTQQPGTDVNDISKNTVGTYNDEEDLADTIAKTQVNMRQSSNAQSWKTQGTRMSRHKKKK